MMIRASPIAWRRRLRSRSRHRSSSLRIGPGVEAGNRVQSMSARSTSAIVCERRLALEEASAGQQLEQHHAERPDVRPLVHERSARLLGAHVGDRAHDGPGASGRHGGEGGRRARIVSRAVPLPSSALARPKSSTLTSPSGVTLTLAGLRSRWMTPLSCAASSASAICRAMPSASTKRDRTASQALGQVFALDQLHHERGPAA